MKYEHDMNSEFKEIFKKLEKILLSFPNIKVKMNEHQTSYYDEYKTIVMLRNSNDKQYFVSSWGNGIKLEEKFQDFSGDGKIVRHMHFKTIKDVDERLIRTIIEESMILNIEYYELQKLKKDNKKYNTQKLHIN